MLGIVPDVLRWGGRVGSVLVVSTYVLLIIGEFTHPHSTGAPDARAWIGIALLSASCVAMLAAWRWELSGALVSLAALIGFNAWVGLNRFDVIAVAAAPGVLYLADWMLRRSLRAA